MIVTKTELVIPTRIDWLALLLMIGTFGFTAQVLVLLPLECNSVLIFALDFLDNGTSTGDRRSWNTCIVYTGMFAAPSFDYYSQQASYKTDHFCVFPRISIFPYYSFASFHRWDFYDRGVCHIYCGMCPIFIA